MKCKSTTRQKFFNMANFFCQLGGAMDVFGCAFGFHLAISDRNQSMWVF